MHKPHESLAGVEQAVARWVLRGEGNAPTHVRLNGLAPEHRLAIYRNNTRMSLTEALRDGYPVVNRLVGTNFFDGLAREFLRRYPPRSSCLLEFGGRLAEFLGEFEPARGLPYLPDVAHLEWLWHEAYHAADSRALDLHKLNEIPRALYADLRLHLHPSARLLTSAYPTLRIWQVNQPGFEGEHNVSLNEGGCRLLLVRPHLEVEMHTLTAGDFVFLQALAAGATLTLAIESALAMNDGFDPLASLRHWLARGLLSGFFFDIDRREG